VLSLNKNVYTSQYEKSSLSKKKQIAYVRDNQLVSQNHKCTIDFVFIHEYPTLVDAMNLHDQHNDMYLMLFVVLILYKFFPNLLLDD